MPTIGTSYSDMRATVTDTKNTVVYSAVDGAGNWRFATRTVEVIEQ